MALPMAALAMPDALPNPTPRVRMTVEHRNTVMIQAPSLRLLSVLLGLSVVAGCASTPSSDDTVKRPVVTTAPLADGSVRGDTDNERIVELWAAAEKARAAGEDALALEYLYDGLDVDPRNGLFWSRAAEIQLRNAEPAIAENNAIKSNSFAGENDALLYRNWLMIEQARDLRGDLLGTRSAHKKVQEYQYR